MLCILIVFVLLVQHSKLFQKQQIFGFWGTCWGKKVRSERCAGHVSGPTASSDVWESCTPRRHISGLKGDLMGCWSTQIYFSSSNIINAKNFKPNIMHVRMLKIPWLLKSAFTFTCEDKVHVGFLWNFSRECQQNATNAKGWGINQWSMTLMTQGWFFKVTKRCRTRWQAALLPHAPLSLIKLFPQICWMRFFFSLFTPHWNIKTLKSLLHDFKSQGKVRKKKKTVRELKSLEFI